MNCTHKDGHFPDNQGFCHCCGCNLASEQTDPTIAELWSVQIQEYPKSIRLTPEQVLDWADKPSPYNRWMSISMTIQHPVGIWYTLDSVENVWGFRYGIEPHQYISGFHI